VKRVSAAPCRSFARAWYAASAFALVSLVARSAAADDDKPLDPNRRELILVPDIGGSSDIGVELGLALSTSKFADGIKPYRWRMDVLASMSFKSDARGFRPVEQDHGVRLDIPHFFHERLRLDSRISFNRYVTAPWYGVGNGTVIEDVAPPADASSTHDYIHEEGRLRSVLRVKVEKALDLAFAGNFRIEAPEAFPTSKLDRDLRAGKIIGGELTFLETIGAGVYIDTRDNEFVTKDGIFYQIGVAETVGTNEKVAYGEASAVLSHYAKLWGPFSFASRVVGSFKFGDVPFYELHTGGVFVPQYLVGGEHGVRGVLMGRFAGLIKVITNIELRAMPYPSIKVFDYRLRIGNTAFFDAGRVWSDYEYDSEKDGHLLGLKVGVGGGFFFQWDESLVFRVDAAYSATNTSKFPVSFYLGTGMSF